MFKLEVEEYCTDCPEFEVDLEKDTYHYTDNMSFTNETVYICNKTIRCKYAKRCKSMIRFLRKKEKEAKDEVK